MTIFNKKTRKILRDRHAKQFETSYSFLKKRIIEIGLERIQGKFDIVVDLGCHTGQVSKVLSNYIQYKTLIQIDISFGMAQIASQSNNTLVACEEKIPIKHNTTDVVLSFMNLHSINNLQSTIRQIQSILKPGGMFIGTVFGPSTLSDLKKAAYNLWGERAINRMYPCIEVKNAGKLMSSAGFTMCSTDSNEILIEYSNVYNLIRDLRGMAESNFLDTKNIPAKKSDYEQLFSLYNTNTANFEVVYLNGFKAKTPKNIEKHKN